MQTIQTIVTALECGLMLVSLYVHWCGNGQKPAA